MEDQEQVVAEADDVMQHCTCHSPRAVSTGGMESTILNLINSYGTQSSNHIE